MQHVQDVVYEYEVDVGGVKQQREEAGADVGRAAVRFPFGTPLWF